MDLFLRWLFENVRTVIVCEKEVKAFLLNGYSLTQAYHILQHRALKIQHRNYILGILQITFEVIFKALKSQNDCI